MLAGASHRGPAGDMDIDTPTHILYTPGTTGRSKGALSTHATLTWQALNTAHANGFAEPGCHQLNEMPLYHAGRLNVMANPIRYFGGAVTTMTRFLPDRVLGLLTGLTPPVTHMAVIPLMYQAIAAQPGWAEADLSHVRHRRLARYKLPTSVVLVEDLPRNVTGKVSRHTLRMQYAVG